MEVPDRTLKASKFHHKEQKQLEYTLLQQAPDRVAGSVIEGGEEYSFNQMAKKRARLNKDYLTTCWVPREDDEVVPVKQESEQAEVKQAKPDENKQEVMLEPSAVAVPDTGGSNSSTGGGPTAFPTSEEESASVPLGEETKKVYDLLQGVTLCSCKPYEYTVTHGAENRPISQQKKI